MSGLDLFDLGFGTAPLAGLFTATTTSEAFGMLDVAWDAGIRYFDTAPHYGQGRAERILGDFLRDKEGGSYVLSTKVGRILTPSSSPVSRLNSFVDPLPFDQAFDYSHDGIMRSVEDSYQRLGLNRIDILLVHDIGAFTHGESAEFHTRHLIESGARALLELRNAGEVAAIGIGVNEVEISERLIDEIPLDILLLAGRYTLLDRTAEGSLLPLCARRGVRVIAGGVFNSGILATGASPDARWNYKPAPQHVLDELSRLERVCRAFDVPLPTAALAFPRRHHVVRSMLLGCGSMAELHDCLARLDEVDARPPTEAFWSEVAAMGLRRE